MPLYLLAAGLVIILCVLFNKLSSRIGMPMLLAFILLGMLFGSDGLLRIAFEDYRLSEQICTVALIFIMFYGGFGTNWNEAKPVAVKAVVLSTAGVAITALLTGLFCYLVLRMPLLKSLLIGSVISSTDAASVFSILRSKKLGLKDNTASLLELESGSNDPCSYMLTAVVLSMMSTGVDGSRVAYLIFAQMVYGVGLGAVIAIGARIFLKRFQFATAGFDIAFIMGVAVLSYALPTLVGGNGYLSAYIVGIVLGNTRMRNKRGLVHFFDGITSLMQMLIFFLLGLLATPSRIPAILGTALAITVFLTFVARPAAVFSMLTPARCSWRQQLLVSFAGLRGAASIVFAIMAMVGGGTAGYDLFHIVFCIVLLSIAFQGSLLAPVARRLEMCDRGIDVLKTFSDYSDEVDLRFIRLKLSEGHPWISLPIREIVLPPNTLITLLLRGGERIVPSGRTLLACDDVLVLSAKVFEESDDIALTEQRISRGSPWLGKPISEFSPNAGELVVMILRGGKTVIPNGKTLLKEDDILVISSQ